MLDDGRIFFFGDRPDDEQIWEDGKGRRDGTAPSHTFRVPLTSRSSLTSWRIWEEKLQACIARSARKVSPESGTVINA
jgi:hypothetical protein